MTTIKDANIAIDIGITYFNSRLSFIPARKAELETALRDDPEKVQKLIRDMYLRHFDPDQDGKLSADLYDKAKTTYENHSWPPAYDNQDIRKLWELSQNALADIGDKEDARFDKPVVPIAAKTSPAPVPAPEIKPPKPPEKPQALKPKDPDPIPAKETPRAPAPPSRPVAIHDDMVERTQRFMMFARDGGFSALQAVDLGRVDGLSGPKTAAGMRALSGKSYKELNGMSTDDFLTLTANKTHGDGDTRTALLAGLRAGIQTKPDQVQKFLTEQNVPVTGNDYAAAIDAYEKSLSPLARYDPSVAHPVAPVAPTAPATQSLLPPYFGLDIPSTTEPLIGKGWKYESPDNDDRAWAQQHCNDSDALARGILRIGDKGQISWTGMVEHRPENETAVRYSLIRRDVTEYIGQNGTDRFYGTDVLMDGNDPKMTGRLKNAFDVLSERPAFDRETGMILPTTVRQTAGDVNYKLRVFEDGDGALHSRLVTNTDSGESSINGLIQTPDSIQNAAWNTDCNPFRTPEAVGALIAGHSNYNNVQNVPVAPLSNTGNGCGDAFSQAATPCQQNIAVVTTIAPVTPAQVAPLIYTTNGNSRR